MSREIITIQGFRTVVHFFLFFFLELTNVDTIKHFFKFLTIHFDRFFLFFPSKHNGSLFIYCTLIKIKFIHVQFHEFFCKNEFHCTQLQLDESTTYNWVILLSSISLKKGRVIRRGPARTAEPAACLAKPVSEPIWIFRICVCRSKRKDISRLNIYVFENM